MQMHLAQLSIGYNVNIFVALKIFIVAGKNDFELSILCNYLETAAGMFARMHTDCNWNPKSYFINRQHFYWAVNIEVF